MSGVSDWVRRIINSRIAGIVVFAFLVRVALMGSLTRSMLQLSVYDVGIYIDFGKKLIESLTRGDIESAAGVNVGTPPLGMLLTGISIKIFGEFLGEIEASMLPQLVASSLTVLPIYLIARRYSEKAAIAASILYALDPYLIQYSLTYLDAVGTLLICLGVLIHMRDGSKKRSLIISGLLLGLASLTKLTFLIFAVIYTLMLTILRHDRKSLLMLAVALPVLLLTPWIWFPEARAKAVEHHLSFNSYLPMVFTGPELIGVPHAHAWYILSYLGLGQVFWNTLPMVSPLVLLFVVVYRSFRRDLSLPSLPGIAASSMILTIFLLPRNYWTYSWGGGVVQGVLTRQFYPYYFYPAGPFLAILAGILIYGSAGECVKYRLVTYPVFLMALLSPIAVVMNLGFPYWDFIFTLIYNYPSGQMAYEGLIATAITTTILLMTIAMTELIHRKIILSQSRPQ
jgi:4-amino-4-deoxy-L-arabinose transferase-like glycosyltransferase